MNFASKFKPGNLKKTVEAAKSMKTVLESLKGIGNQLGDIVGATLKIGLIIENAFTTGDIERNELEAEIEEIDSSKAKIYLAIEKVKEGLDVLEDYTSDQDKDDGKAGKMERVLNASLEILTNVTTLLAQLALFVDALADATKEGANLQDQGKLVLADIKIIGKRVLDIKDDVSKIVDIIRGNEIEDKEGDGAKLDKVKKSENKAQENKGEDKNQVKDKQKSMNDKGISVDDTEEVPGCWSKFKAFFSWCPCASSDDDE